MWVYTRTPSWPRSHKFYGGGVLDGDSRTFWELGSELASMYALIPPITPCSCTACAILKYPAAGLQHSTVLISLTVRSWLYVSTIMGWGPSIAPIMGTSTFTRKVLEERCQTRSPTVTLVMGMISRVFVIFLFIGMSD
eukprot:GFYU01007229.1.p1 GENE.GFYU01007229.1~~GFYU01007229.1.p1  ORF type:complete len:138 (+),score=14.95 GFYU01007229.1:636-1049(+)